MKYVHNFMAVGPQQQGEALCRIHVVIHHEDAQCPSRWYRRQFGGSRWRGDWYSLFGLYDREPDDELAPFPQPLATGDGTAAVHLDQALYYRQPDPQPAL